MVAIGGTGSGVDKSANLGVPGCDQHIQKTVDVRPVGSYRILDRTGNRAQCSLMQYIVNAGTGHAAALLITDISLYETEIHISRLATGISQRLIQVALVSCGKVIQSDNLLI